MSAMPKRPQLPFGHLNLTWPINRVDTVQSWRRQGRTAREITEILKHEGFACNERDVEQLIRQLEGHRSGWIG